MKTKKEIEDILLMIKMCLDKNDLKKLDMLNVQLHFKIQNYIKFYDRKGNTN